MIITDKKVEKMILKVDPEAALEHVLYVVIHNGVHAKDRILWTKIRKLFFWFTVSCFTLQVIFPSLWIVPFIAIFSSGIWGACFSLINDSGFLVKDNRGYTFYLQGKWPYSIKESIPLSLDEIKSSTPVEEIFSESFPTIELTVKGEYYQVATRKKTLGLKKQKNSFKTIVPDFITETMRSEQYFQ